MRHRPWRVFLSYTSDLRQHPRGRSFAAAAEAAVVHAGHAVADMTYFAAGDVTCVEHCARMVASADVYVGIIGLRYGTPAHGRPDLSYVELEFELATRCGLPRFIFQIRADAPSLPPVRQSVEHCARQEAFRGRLRDTGAVISYVVWPADLELRVLHSLSELRAESVAWAALQVRCGQPTPIRGPMPPRS